MDGIKSRMKEKIAQMMLPDSDEEDSEDENSESCQTSLGDRLTRYYHEYSSHQHHHKSPNLLQVPSEKFRRESQGESKDDSCLTGKKRERTASLFGSLFRRKSSRNSQDNLDDDHLQQTNANGYKLIIHKRSNSIAVTK